MMKSRKNLKHVPVLKNEAIEGLRIIKSGKYIDVTIGDAGHALEIVKKGGFLLGIDRDPRALERATKVLSVACSVSCKDLRNSTQTNFQKLPQARLVQGNFSQLNKIAKNENFLNCQGVLFDLGISNYQLLSGNIGLSFFKNEPLDMRLDPNLKTRAQDLINNLTKEELYEIFTRNAQEELAGPIAETIVSSRNLKPIERTSELVEIISKIKKRRGKIHPATKIFLALRIEVNNEIENLKKGIRQAINILAKKGRLVIISFQETEDRIVKNIYKKSKKEGLIKIITKKPVRPNITEISKNLRSRSAIMRIAEKI